MRVLKSQLVLLTFAAMTVSGCQDKVIVEDTTPFGTTVRLGDTVVAEVNETKIYLSDMERYARAEGLIETGETLEPGTDLYDQVIKELIDQRLLALEALHRQLDQTDDTRRRMAIAKERILGSVLLETYLQSEVTDENVRRLYDEQAQLQRRGDEVRARHIVVDSREEAEAIIARLEGGDAFEEVAGEASLDDLTSGRGGDLGWFTPDMLSPEMVRAAFFTPAGEIAAPFETDDGWHVLRVDGRRSLGRVSFEDMEEEIREYMVLQAIDELISDLRADAVIERMDGGLVEERPVLEDDDDETFEMDLPEEDEN